MPGCVISTPMDCDSTSLAGRRIWVLNIDHLLNCSSLASFMHSSCSPSNERKRVSLSIHCRVMMQCGSCLNGIPIGGRLSIANHRWLEANKLLLTESTLLQHNDSVSFKSSGTFQTTMVVCKLLESCGRKKRLLASVNMVTGDKGIRNRSIWKS